MGNLMNLYDFAGMLKQSYQTNYFETGLMDLIIDDLHYHSRYKETIKMRRLKKKLLTGRNRVLLEMYNIQYHLGYA